MSTESLTFTSEFDPTAEVVISMGTIRTVLENIWAVYDAPVVVGGIVMPGAGVTALHRKHLNKAIVTLIEAIPKEES